jgi:hypothetical protein
MVGIRVHARKKVSNVLLGNYKLVEEKGKMEVCILIVLLSYYMCSTYWIKRTGLNISYII